MTIAHLLVPRCAALQHNPPQPLFARRAFGMLRLLSGAMLLMAALLSGGVQAQTIQTVAGIGMLGPDGAPAILASIARPGAVVTDSGGNLYIADSGNHIIRKVATDGTISTVAGVGTSGNSGDGGPATSAKLKDPRGLAFNSAGELYIADRGNHRIRKVATDGTISTVAGGTYGFAGDDGQAVSARLASPHSIAFDGIGNLYIADNDNHRIRKVATSGVITTLAGDGTQGFGGDGAQASGARLSSPKGVALDGAGNLYIADTGNHRVRKIATTGIITTVAGDGVQGYAGDGGQAAIARLDQPHGVALDSAGVLYMADRANHRIRKVATNGVISNVVGQGPGGFAGDGGPATSAQLQLPGGLALDTAGNLYVADTDNNRIRKIATTGIIATVAGNGTRGFTGDGGPATSAQLNTPYSMTFDSAGTGYIADVINNRIRKLAADGTISTVAGSGIEWGFSGDGGPATSAQLFNPFGSALDGAGNLYIADTGNSRIRKVAPDGTISTVAGTGTSGFSGDGGQATSAQLHYPDSMALDNAGNVYFSDSANHTVRKIATNGIISTLAGDGSSGFSGDGGQASAAKLASPASIALDNAGNLYLADANNHRVRKIATNGIITTVAGTVLGFAGDGGPATSARLYFPGGLALDSIGNLYIADTGNHRVRKVATDGVITTVAGDGNLGFSGDGGAATDAQFEYPRGVALNSAGHLYIVDTNNHRIRQVMAVALGSPTALTAIAGNSTVQLTWAAPASDGGSAITGYTVTGAPSGSCTAAAPGTTCTVAGLTNGTQYSFTVVATNSQGDSAASAPAVATPAVPITQTLALPGGAGHADVVIAGAPAGCTVAPADMQFGNAIPPGAPATASFPLGVFSFTATGCPAATLRISVTYPVGSLAGLTMFKVGPHGVPRQTGWFPPPGLSVVGDTVSFTVTDDGDGDSNTTTPGTITDPLVPTRLAAGPTSTQAIPTLGEWGVALLSLLAAALGMGVMRRKARHKL